MKANPATPLVHLELHTGDLLRAGAFYAALCGWQPERIELRDGSYMAVSMGDAGVGGGIVECSTAQPIWLPYVEVPEITAATRRAQALGADLALPPREGPAGWRSVVRSSAGGEIALWQPKR